MSHDQVSRKRYANKKVIKKRIRKSVRTYPIRISNQKAVIFSKKVLEKINGMSLRNIFGILDREIV
mgnify:CR=1 FL=1